METLPEKQILKNIQNGESINSQAKKYNTSWDRIKRLCKKNKVVSKHKSSRITDDDLLTIIRLNKVLTTIEILKKLKMLSHRNLVRRLRQLVTEGKLQTVILPNTRTKYKHTTVLGGYTDVHLFYVSDKELSSWVEKKIPKHMPQHLRKAITMKLNNVGIHIQLSKPSADYRPVTFSLEHYKKLQEKAKKEKLSIPKLILKYTLK